MRRPQEIAWLVLAACVASCGGFKRGASTAGPDDKAPTALSFAADVLPVLHAKECKRCHTGDPEDGWNLTGDTERDHGTTLEYVDTDMPSESPLLLMPLGLMSRPHARLLVEDSDEYRTILQWIEQGAPP